MKFFKLYCFILGIFVLQHFYSLYAEIIFLSSEGVGTENINGGRKVVKNFYLLDPVTSDLINLTESAGNFINNFPNLSKRQNKIVFSSLRECNERFIEKESFEYYEWKYSNKIVAFPPLWFPVDKYILSPYEIKAASRCGWNIHIVDLRNKEEKIVTLFAWDEVKPVYLKNNHIVYLLNVEGMNFLFETEECGNKWWWLSGKPNEFVNYEFTNDRKFMVYQSYIDNNWEVFKMNINTLERTRLTQTSNVSETFPKWSYDGKQILYLDSKINGRGFNEIGIMNADGSNKRVLSTGIKKHRDVNFFPDGKGIIFSAFIKDNWDIHTFDITARKLTRLTHTLFSEYNATPSPDGKKIAYIVENKNKYYLYGMNVDGSDQSQLTSIEVANFKPIWF